MKSESVKLSADVERLIAQARGENREAFGELVLLYKYRLLKIALGLVGNPQDADDVVQNALLRAMKAMRSFEGRSSFYTWLVRIVMNEAFQFLRWKGRDKKYLLFAGLGQEQDGSSNQDGSVVVLRHGSLSTGSVFPSQDEMLTRTELYDRLLALFQNLSAQNRRIFAMRILGFTARETAERTGLTVRAVKKRLFVTRRVFRSRMRRDKQKGVRKTR